MSEVRLIDANALKKAINDFFDNHFKGLVPNELITYAKAVDNAIDNAPTVDTFTFDDMKKGINVGYKAGRLTEKWERPQGEFADLERKVIADSINYLLGAELLEENGYTETVINALKSVLQKIGAEENHL